MHPIFPYYKDEFVPGWVPDFAEAAGRSADSPRPVVFSGS
jgi:hypothetical protein